LADVGFMLRALPASRRALGRRGRELSDYALGDVALYVVIAVSASFLVTLSLHAPLMVAELQRREDEVARARAAAAYAAEDARPRAAAAYAAANDANAAASNAAAVAASAVAALAATRRRRPPAAARVPLRAAAAALRALDPRGAADWAIAHAGIPAPSAAGLSARSIDGAALLEMGEEALCSGVMGLDRGDAACVARAVEAARGRLPRHAAFTLSIYPPPHADDGAGDPLKVTLTPESFRERFARRPLLLARGRAALCELTTLEEAVEAAGAAEAEADAVEAEGRGPAAAAAVPRLCFS